MCKSKKIKFLFHTKTKKCPIYTCPFLLYDINKGVSTVEDGGKAVKKLITFLICTLLLCGAALAEEQPVLCLKLDGTVEDASPNGLHGKLNKEGAYVEGVSGQALYFDGRTTIDLGTSGLLQPSELTVSMWIKADGVLSGEHMLAWFKPGGNYRGSGWYLSCLDNSTPLKLSVGPSTGQPMELFVSGSRSAFFPDGEWVHIAVTYSSASHACTIYRNGVAQAVQHINGVSEITADSIHHKWIGFNSPGYNGGYCRLAMDEVTIYPSVLSAEEIVALYTQFGETFDGSSVVEADYAALTLPMTSIRDSIALPETGQSGSSIRWTTSNASALTAEGKVTRPAAGENDATVTLTAVISYGQCRKEKTFQVCVEAMPAFNHLSDFSMAEVSLGGAYERNAFEKEVAYLKSLDADRLLKGFCLIGGVESDAQQYGGWETSAIQGHTLGHYLTALSQAYATGGDEELKAIADHIVSVLAQCQAENGYLAAIPENHFDKIEQGNTSGTWVPWYNLHKTVAGLVSCYELTGNTQALEVCSRLGDWVYSHTSKWTPAMQATVLKVEYGGMNDCLYQLYRHTGKQEHLDAAHAFDEMTLFDALYRGEDVLNGKHANTTIPKIVGALNRYLTLGESEGYYLQVAENFWAMVVGSHTYITGGNSEWEHFGQPGILDAERTNCNCETCNTYNMLKLTRELFKVTGKAKYADYYENTFINAILSSQNPETGMTTYFQPMATGFFKVYSSADQHFWCCTGSGMENFSKLDDSIYYHDDSALYITRYTPSTLAWAEKGLTLTQETNLPLTDTVRMTIAAEKAAEAAIVLRVPDWCTGVPSVSINGEVAPCEAVNGFITLRRTWADGDTIALTLPMAVTVHPLPDNPYSVAFKYGPVVLSANMGQNNMTTGVTGVNVTIPNLDSSLSGVLTITQGTVEEWLQNIEGNLVRQCDELAFTLKGTEEEWVFTPHYQQHTQRYGLYFVLRDATMAVETDENDRYTVIDSLPVANDQYEFSHNLQATSSATGMHKGLNYRDAAPGGSFSYDLAVEQGVTNYLQVKYFSGDVGRRFVIRLNGEVWQTVTLENVNPDNFYDVLYPLPEEAVAGRETVTVTFEASLNSYAGGIFEKISVVKEK